MNKKRFDPIHFSVIMVLTMLTYFACSNQADKPNHVPVKEHGESKAHTSAYVCPMHCAGSGSEAPGVCPNCGMNYQALEEHVKNGHVH
jgi:hypothetical protein